MDKVVEKAKAALHKDSDSSTSKTNTSSTSTAHAETHDGNKTSTGQVEVPLPATGTSGPGQTLQSSGPAFDPAHITVIYVLGGPGAGKGTQCQRLVAEKQYVHLSAGDLLRAEQNRTGSEVGQLIRQYIKEGTIVPMEITIGLLRTAMQEAMDQSGKSRFLIDGFPRKLDQAFKFDETVCPGSAVLFLTCPEDVLLERLLERGKTSGREDDNAESIKKRFRTFIETSMPVVDHYRQEGKVIDINSSKPIEAVYADISSALDKLQRRKSLSLEGKLPGQ